MFLTISSVSSVNQQHVALAQLRFFNKLFEVSLVQWFNCTKMDVSSHFPNHKYVSTRQDFQFDS